MSNYITNEGLPGFVNFSDTCDDPSNFRLEVEDDTQGDKTSVSVILTINETEYTFVLDKKNSPTGHIFRGQFLRLVSDSVDDGVQGNQTLLCKLSDAVQILYSNNPGICEDKITTTVGRLHDSTPDNGPNQLKHEIRFLAAVAKVFAKPRPDGVLVTALSSTDTTINGVWVSGNPQPSGWVKIGSEFIQYTGVSASGVVLTGCTRGVDGSTAAAHASGADITYSTKEPSVTEASVQQDVDIANQRFAQSTFRLNVTIQMNNGIGFPLPSVLLDGFRWGKEGPASPWNEDELKLISMKSGNANTVDVFYITPFAGPPPPVLTGVAIAYPAFLNVPPHEVPNGKNFIVIAALSDAAKKPFTFAHEFMHILLNITHRPGEPIEALFRFPTSDTNTVGATKRIGPFPNSDPGEEDTFTMRTNVLNLP